MTPDNTAEHPEHQATPTTPGKRPRLNAERYSCGGCANTWTGLNTCHCGSCHKTLSGVALFDKHRRLRGETGYCVDPATMTERGQPLRLVDGVWRSPAMPARALDARRGNAS